MGIAQVPAPAAGGIKSVQRGNAVGAGTVTITAVDISKSFVTVFGTASSGTVAATGTVNAANGTASNSYRNDAPTPSYPGNQNTGYIPSNVTGYDGGSTSVLNVFNSAVAMYWNRTGNSNIGLNATNITGGSNNLVAAVVQGYLNSSTQLVVSGACRWEVVEFN